MPHAPKMEIWVGPAGSGKTAAALAAYREVLHRQSLPRQRRALWLAPTFAAASEARERLLDAAPSGPAALLDPGVTTWAGFAAEVAWEAGRRVRTLGSIARRYVLQQVVAGAMAANSLRFFRREAAAAGVVNQLDELVARLKRRDTSSEVFAQQARRLTPRERDLAELYARYEARLQHLQAVDAEGLLTAARDGLRAVEELGSQLELVVVDGFTDFTAVQLRILAMLTQRARRVVVTLLGEAPGGGPATPDGSADRRWRSDLFAIPGATARTLEELGACRSGGPGGGAGADAVPPVVGQAQPAALAHLERNIFRNYRDVEPAPAAVRQSLERIQIVAASSVQAELEEIARRVKRLLLAGVAAEDVAIVFRSAPEVADRARRTLDDFGVPAFIDWRPRLAATPSVRSLLNLLRLQAEDWPYRRLLQTVGDQSIRIPAGGARDTVATWPAEAQAVVDPRTAAELCVRHAQLPSGRDELLGLVESWAGGDGVSAPVEPEQARVAAGVLSRLAGWFRGQPARARVGEWIKWLQAMSAEAGLADGEPGLGSATRADVPGGADAAALVRALREIASLHRHRPEGDIELSYAEFVELAASAADETPAPREHDATGRVRVLSAEAARFIRPRHLFIGGLSEQAFPAGRLAADESRGDSSRAASDGDSLEDAAAEGLDGVTVRRPAGEVMLLFYQLVTRPTESLTLSYPALDAKAQPMPPSPYLVELERAFRDAPLPKTVQPLGYGHDVEGPPLSRGDLRRSAVQRAELRKRDLLASLVRSPRHSALGQSILDGIEAVAGRSDRRRFGAHDGIFASDDARAILERRFGPDFLWSPSLLETYAACPFQFFSRQVLRLSPPPELALESDLARRGSLLHDTLARLYARLAEAADDAGPPTPEAVAEQFQRTLDAVVHARPARGIQRALREIERRQIASWAPQFAQQHTEYAAAWRRLDAPLAARHFETRFGPKNRRSESEDDARLSTDQPFELQAGGETLRFAGQIDRIDVGRVGGRTVFNVIDYKTSAYAKVNREQMEAGTQLQLPLYAMAAAELLLADQQALPLAAGYWSIKGKGFGIGARSGGPLMIGEIKDGRVELSASWTELRQSLLARITEIVTGIRRGWFPVYSADKNCTQYCEYSTTCRIAHARSLEKTWSPPVEGA